MKKFGIAVAIALLCLLVLGACTTTRDRRDAKVHYTLGLSYMREPNYSRALQELLLANEYNAQDSAIHLALGQVYQSMKAYPEAEKSYKRALSLSEDKDLPLAQNNLAALYLDMGRWDDAIRYFELASKNLFFQSPEVSLTGIGYAYHQKGDYLNAISAYKKAIEVNRQYALSYLRMGESYEALGKVELAVSAYGEVVKLVPDNAPAQYKLGLAAAKVGKKSLAIRAFQEVMRLAPDSEDARLARDHVHLLQ